ncbi:hypothetical protein I6F35_13145 [Bradyrhizobium sp. BRP22]|uniref:hypothetical protein n=1 Tax=Bradyrhizobium sp. BRP22 TaxID=2793821 RepID=UPI001CD5FD2A|nr:hypothetical protein [Bradyrhizobium sp. BRP22]MCA1454155.1 hypothetical protein [Bradyrhizobium sp. BRP22]
MTDKTTRLLSRQTNVRLSATASRTIGFNRKLTARKNVQMGDFNFNESDPMCKSFVEVIVDISSRRTDRNLPLAISATGTCSSTLSINLTSTRSFVGS